MLPSATQAKSIAAEPSILIRSTAAVSSCVIARLSVFLLWRFPWLHSHLSNLHEPLTSEAADIRPHNAASGHTSHRATQHRNGYWHA
jgi:hypothetical protein